MQGNRELLDILVCPCCQGKLKCEIEAEDDLGIVKGEFSCVKCEKQFRIQHGLVDVRVETGKHGKWDVKTFEAAYREVGHYRDNCDWAAKAGIPRIVEDYRFPLVKGRLLNWLNPADGAFILDVGCGIGWFPFLILDKYEHRALRFTGIDIADVNVARLETARRAEKRADIVGLLANAEVPPFVDGTFDIIVCSEVLEHIYDYKRALGEMYRLLKPGGRLLISTPSRLGVSFWKGMFLTPQVLYRIFHGKSPFARNHGYDRPLFARALKNILKDIGFEILRFEKAVLLIHESYYCHLPVWCANASVRAARFLEGKLDAMKFLRLHCIVECQKT